MRLLDTSAMTNFNNTFKNTRLAYAYIAISFLLSVTLYSCNQPAGQITEAGDSYLKDFFYTGYYLDISEQTLNARASHWKPDGSMIFVTGRYTDNVAAYKVETAWDLSTANFDHKMEVPGEFQHGLFLHPEGTKMWVFDRTSIWSFDLEGAWDLTSRSEGHNTYLGDFVERGHDIDFTPDGSVLFIDDRNTGAVFAVSLTEAWEVESKYSVETLDISDIQKEIRGIEFLKNGTIMVLMDTGRNEILEFHLSEAYNIMTAQWVATFDVSEQTLQGRGLSFNADETRFYVTGRDEEKIFQYEWKNQ